MPRGLGTGLWYPRRAVSEAPTPPPPAWTPADFATLALWGRGGDADAYNNNDPMPQWDDIGGGAHHLTQAAGASQPTYKANIINGRNVGRFDGGDDMEVAHHADFVVAGGMILWAAVQNGNLGNSEFILSKDGEAGMGAVREWRLLRGAVNQWGFSISPDGTNWSNVNTIPTIDNGGWHYLVSYWDGTNIHILVDGAEPGAPTPQNAIHADTRPIVLGGRYVGGVVADKWTGDIAEFGYVPVPPQGTEINDLNTYLAARYGI